MTKKKTLVIILACVAAIVTVSVVAVMLLKPKKSSSEGIGTVGVSDEEKDVFSDIKDELLAEIREVFPETETIRSYDFSENDDFCYLDVTDNNNNKYAVIYNKSDESFTWEYTATSETPPTRPLKVDESKESEEVEIEEDIRTAGRKLYEDNKDWVLEEIEAYEGAVGEVFVLDTNTVYDGENAQEVYLITDTGVVYCIKVEGEDMSVSDVNRECLPDNFSFEGHYADPYYDVASEEDEEELNPDDYTIEELVANPELWFKVYYDWMLEQARYIDSSIESLTLVEDVEEVFGQEYIIYVIANTGDLYYVLSTPFADGLVFNPINPETDCVPEQVLKTPGLGEAYLGMATEPDDFFTQQEEEEEEYKSPEERIKEEIASCTDWMLGIIPEEMEDGKRELNSFVKDKFEAYIVGYVISSYKDMGDAHVVYCLLTTGVIQRCNLAKDFSWCKFYEVGMYRDKAPFDYICQDGDILLASYYDCIFTNMKEQASDIINISVAEHEYRGYEEAHLVVSTNVNLTWGEVTFKDGKISLFMRRY